MPNEQQEPSGSAPGAPTTPSPGTPAVASPNAAGTSPNSAGSASTPTTGSSATGVNGNDPAVLQTLFNHSVSFSKSGLFFIILGCGFLYLAYHVLYHVHPTFVFVLALLGLSIVLFGTGTQSLGAGEFTDPASKAKAKVYLAGGAGLLAGLFGFGAVLGAEKIERVFSNSRGYALVVFEITNPGGSDLQRAIVTTSLRDGRQLPVLIRDTSIEVLAPVSREYATLDVCIEAKGPQQKWTIEHGCPTLSLTDNVPGQRPEPVQSLGTGKLNIRYVNTLGLDENGKATQTPAFVAN